MPYFPACIADMACAIFMLMKCNLQVSHIWTVYFTQAGDHFYFQDFIFIHRITCPVKLIIDIRVVNEQTRLTVRLYKFGSNLVRLTYELIMSANSI